jgi:hypothetical protein
MFVRLKQTNDGMDEMSVRLKQTDDGMDEMSVRLKQMDDKMDETSFRLDDGSGGLRGSHCLTTVRPASGEASLFLYYM